MSWFRKKKGEKPTEKKLEKKPEEKIIATTKEVALAVELNEMELAAELMCTQLFNKNTEIIRERAEFWDALTKKYNLDRSKKLSLSHITREITQEEWKEKN